MFFVVNEVSVGTELWISDGTEEGTRLAADVTPGVNSTLFEEFESGPNGELYFSTSCGSSCDALWKSDGTPAGTTQVATFNHIYELRAGGDRLYLSASNGSGWLSSQPCHVDPNSSHLD